MIHDLNLDPPRRRRVSRRDLANEARECRRRAAKFAGRPEHQFLLKLAAAFDTLLVAEDRKRAASQRSHRKPA